MLGHALANARVERAHHLRTFRGRRALLDAFTCAERAPGRFTLVVGGPGAGKSALLAKLSSELGAPFHFIGSHRDPRRFIPALLAQTLAAAGAEPTRTSQEPQSTDDLKNELGAAMELLVQATGRAVVVIDAVDELLDPASILEFLPARLVDGAEIILSARSDLRLLTTLRARVEPLCVVTLAPITRQDLAEETTLPAAELELLIRATSGLALLLMPALAHAERAGRVDVQSIATTAEHLFEGLLLEVKTRGGPEAETLLGVLAVAREPIDLAMISSVVSALEQPSIVGGELTACRRSLEAASRALESGEGGAVRLWHASFAEFMRERVLGARGVEKIHRAFSSACASQRGSAYELRHAVAHLAGAGDTSGAQALATQPERIARSLAEDLLSELLADLTYADSPLLDVVRRHAAFLLAQPTEHARALASVLTFEGREAFSPSGAWLRIEHRDRAERALPGHVLRENTAEVLAITLHEDLDRSTLASASADGHLRVFDASTGEQLVAVKLTERRALAVAFSPDGSSIACGTDEGLFALNLGAHGTDPARLLHGSAPIWGTAWLSNTEVVAGARDGALTIVTPTGDVVWRGAVHHPITAVAADGEHRLLICGAREGFTILGAPEGFVEGRPLESTRIERSFERPTWAVGSRADRIVVARHDGKLQLFDRSGVLLSSYDLPTEELFALALHQTEDLVACGGTSGRVHLLSVVESELRAIASWKAHDGWINALAWRGHELFSAGTDGTIRSHPTRSHLRDQSPDDVRAKPSVVVYAPRADTLAVGYFDGTLELRAAESQASLVKLQAFPRTITAIAFAPRMIAVGSSEGALALFRLQTNAKTRALDLEWLTSLEGHEAEITCVRFLGNGSHQGLFATASRDHRVCVFSIVGRRLVSSVLLESSVVSLEESADGSALVARLRSGDNVGLALPTLESTTIAPQPVATRLLSGTDARARNLGIAGHECAVVDEQDRVLARAPFVFKSASRAPKDRQGEWTCVTEDGLVRVVLES